MKTKQPRGRFMRNGNSARPESPLICASVQSEKGSRKENTKRERIEKERNRKRERDELSQWYRRQMHLHSVPHLVQLSTALLQRPRWSPREREGEKEETVGNVTEELFYSVM